MDDILNILRNNAAMPVDKIARLVNQTADEVAAKIKDWESNGTILGYTTVINTDKLHDEPQVMAMIEVKITPEREGGFDKIARKIARYPEVKSCYLMSGGFDLLVMVEGDNLRQVAGFVSERLARFRA
jgi:DNA-binding Lrp family transcriptional regulator